MKLFQNTFIFRNLKNKSFPSNKTFFFISVQHGVYSNITAVITENLEKVGKAAALPALPLRP